MQRRILTAGRVKIVSPGQIRQRKEVKGADYISPSPLKRRTSCSDRWQPSGPKFVFIRAA